MNVNDTGAQGKSFLISHDCFECVNCKTAETAKDGNIHVQCMLQEMGYAEVGGIDVCPHYKFKMFEMKDQKSFLPYHIWIEITNACNLKCRMCGQRGTFGYLNSPDSEMKRKNLPLEAWKEFIDDVKSFRPTILLRGGEPLLYPGVTELMRHISESNLFLVMDTNGTYLKKHAREVAKYVDHVNVSIDGPRDVHDYIRGVPGTYDSAREGIAAVQDVYRELKIRRIQPISLNFVVSPDNYKLLPQMVDVAKELGVTDVTLTLCFAYDNEVEQQYDEDIRKRFNIPSRAGKGFRKDKVNMDGDLLARNIRLLLDNKEIKFQLIPHINDESIKTWFDDSGMLVSYDRCYAPWFLVNVMPDGDVNFCADIGDYIIGNITEHSLKDIWFGEKAESFRTKILEERFSICRRCPVNFFYPYNRNSGLLELRTASRIIKRGVNLPFVKKFCRKHEWLSHSFY
jgi:MoaA/NifB/PqqE/SkfB family radical SAM enzyme